MAADPSVHRLPDPALVRRFARFPVRSRLPMEGGFTGIHRGLHHGAGSEFAEYRRYAPGDDMTRLDWRVYGRSDRFYVKESETDSDLVCHLIIDATGSMGYGSGARTKLAVAREVAAVLAVLLLRQGDAVGLSSVGGTPALDIAPRRTAAHGGVLGAALASLQAGGNTDVVAALASLCGRLRRRGLVWLFSDAFCDPEALVSRLGVLARRGHDVTLLLLSDPQEEAFAFAGTVRFEDLEGGPDWTVDADAVAPDFRQRLAAHRQCLRDGCCERGVRVVDLSTGEDAGAALTRFLGGKSRCIGRGSRDLPAAGRGDHGAGPSVATGAGRSVGQPGECP
jgi:uncharacterized protein (DUF58 family)